MDEAVQFGGAVAQTSVVAAVASRLPDILCAGAGVVTIGILTFIGVQIVAGVVHLAVKGYRYYSAASSDQGFIESGNSSSSMNWAFNNKDASRPPVLETVSHLNSTETLSYLRLSPLFIEFPKTHTVFCQAICMEQVEACVQALSQDIYRNKTDVALIESELGGERWYTQSGLSVCLLPGLGGL